MISAKPMIALSGVLISWTSSRSESGSASASAPASAAARLGRFAQRNSAIAGEAAVGGLERGHAADLPIAGDQPLAGHRHRRVAKRRADHEGAHDIRVDAVPVAVLARAIERPISGPRGAPSTQAISPPGPHSQRNSDGEPCGMPAQSFRRGASPRGSAAGARSARRRRGAKARRAPIGRARSSAGRSTSASVRSAAAARCDFRMEGLDEAARLLVGDGEQRLPLLRRRALPPRAPVPTTASWSEAKYSSRPSGSGKARDGAGRGGPQVLVDIRRIGADGLRALGPRSGWRRSSRRARPGRPAAASAPRCRGGRRPAG